MPCSWQRTGENPIGAEHRPAPCNKSGNHFSPVKHQLGVTTEPRRCQQTQRLKQGDRSAYIWKPVVWVIGPLSKPTWSQYRTPNQNWNPNTTGMGPQCHEICGRCPWKVSKDLCKTYQIGSGIFQTWQHTQASFSSPWRTIYLNGIRAMSFLHWNYKYIVQHRRANTPGRDSLVFSCCVSSLWSGFWSIWVMCCTWIWDTWIC